MLVKYRHSILSLATLVKCLSLFIILVFSLIIIHSHGAGFDCAVSPTENTVAALGEKINSE